VKLNTKDESVLVDRTGVRGAPAQRLAVGLAGSSDVLSRNCGERDKLDGVDFDLTEPDPVTAALLDPWPLPQPDRERDVSGQDVIAQLPAEFHNRRVCSDAPDGAIRRRMCGAQTTGMAFTQHETKQIAEANVSGCSVVVLAHGFWLMPNSWDSWRELFEEAGYATVAPSWPGAPETVGEARRIQTALPGRWWRPWANAVSELEAEHLYDKFVVAAPGSALFQVACANLNPWSQASVDIKYRHRGPLLLVSGTEDNMVPAAVTNAAFKLQRRNRGLTEMAEVVSRGHSVTIDSGWREVAEAVLAFINRFI
jgi:pimeloyl-ACP methyl ester carboxylesterase